MCSYTTLWNIFVWKLSCSTVNVPVRSVAQNTVLKNIFSMILSSFGSLTKRYSLWPHQKPWNDRIYVSTQEERLRSKMPKLHINSVQSLAYGVTWRFGFASLILNIPTSRLKINVASNLLLLQQWFSAIRHRPLSRASSSSLSRISQYETINLFAQNLVECWPIY